MRGAEENVCDCADIFLTETAALADVVLPAASLYEKAGTVTNTYGDVQLARKAADHAV